MPLRRVKDTEIEARERAEGGGEEELSLYAEERHSCEFGEDVSPI